MMARGDSLGYSRSPGSNYYAGLAHQSMFDLDAVDAARVPAFHSLWVGKAGGELLRSKLNRYVVVRNGAVGCFRSGYNGVAQLYER